MLCLGAAAFLTALSLGCMQRSSADSPVPSPAKGEVVLVDHAPETALAADPAQDAAETPQPEETPAETYSVTTGRLLSADWVYHPALVVIGNTPQTRPQTGLMQADIIYESVSERNENNSRLICLFADEIPACVGPIQSARSFDARLQREWNGMFVYNGYPDEADYPELDESNILYPVDYAQALSSYFYTDKTVSSEPENSVFCRLRDLTEDMYLSGGSVPAPHFQFSFGASYEFGRAVDRVGIPMNGSDKGKIEFVYAPDDNRFYRYERNSKGTLTQSKTRTPDESGVNLVSEPVSVQNLIVQYVRVANLTEKQRDISLTGTGECEYFVGGVHVSGVWKREAPDQPTAYFLNDGSPLVLQPGNTWVVLEPSLREIKVRYAAARD